jgi:gamma-glutamyl-gamma-aminobutyrate hydrolase PuuD
MGRPIIGITGELEAAHWGSRIREAVLSPVSYTRAIERAGGTPVVLPPVPAASVRRLVTGLDALVLSGGADVNPVLYEAAPHQQSDEPDRRRDRFEMALVRAAIDAGLPFLGIGRGMHVLNVARGGSLVQHLPDTVGTEGHKPDRVKLGEHDIRLAANSQLGRLLGAAAQVPGAHHQGIDRIGNGLLAVGWADDQVVEAVELQGFGFGIGVQWHPEEGDDLRVFKALVEAAAGSEAEEEVAGKEELAGKDAAKDAGKEAPAAKAPAAKDAGKEAPAAKDAGKEAPAAKEPPAAARGGKVNGGKAKEGSVPA